jgi:hypothetical protein
MYRNPHQSVRYFSDNVANVEPPPAKEKGKLDSSQKKCAKIKVFPPVIKSMLTCSKA